MRGWLCPTLGFWHPYKQACALVWEHGLVRWFGPFFKRLIPGGNVSVRPRLVSIVTYMSYFRLAYDDPQLRRTLAVTAESLEQKRQIGSRRYCIASSYIQDLRDLLEFFIPVVTTWIRVVVVYTVSTSTSVLLILTKQK